MHQTCCSQTPIHHKSNWFPSEGCRHFGEEKRWGHLFHLASSWMPTVRKGQRSILDSTFFPLFKLKWYQQGSARYIHKDQSAEKTLWNYTENPWTVLLLLLEYKSMCTSYTHSPTLTHTRTQWIYVWELSSKLRRESNTTEDRKNVSFLPRLLPLTTAI